MPLRFFKKDGGIVQDIISDLEAEKKTIELEERLKFLKGLYLRNLMITTFNLLGFENSKCYRGISSKPELVKLCKKKQNLFDLLKYVEVGAEKDYERILKRIRSLRIVAIFIPIIGWLWLYRNRSGLTLGNTNIMALIGAKKELEKYGIETEEILNSFVFKLSDSDYDIHLFRRGFCEKEGIDDLEFTAGYCS